VVSCLGFDGSLPGPDKVQVGSRRCHGKVLMGPNGILVGSINSRMKCANSKNGLGFLKVETILWKLKRFFRSN
jgi:hypothetical protein